MIDIRCVENTVSLKTHITCCKQHCSGFSRSETTHSMQFKYSCPENELLSEEKGAGKKGCLSAALSAFSSTLAVPVPAGLQRSARINHAL